MTNHSGGNIQAVNIYLSPDIHGSFLNKTLRQWALQAFVEKWVKRWIFTVVWCRNPHININHLNSQFMKYWFIVLPYMSESVSVFSVISAFSHIEVKKMQLLPESSCVVFFIHHIPHSTVNCSLYSRQFQCMNILEIRSSVSVTTKTITGLLIKERRGIKGKTHRFEMIKVPMLNSHVILNAIRGNTSKWAPFSKTTSCPYFPSKPVHNATWLSLFMWGNERHNSNEWPVWPFYCKCAVAKS